MKLFALLSWWNEPPQALTDTVTSLTKIGVDHLIAVDGAFRMMPGRTVRSGYEQVEAIARACDATGIGLTMHQPSTIWTFGDQAKRDHMFRMLQIEATVGEDWVLVIDADEVIHDATLDVRAELERLDDDVLMARARLWLRKPHWLATGGSEETAAKFYVDDEIAGMQSRLWRVVDDMRVEVTHYTYAGTWKGKRYALRGDTDEVGVGELGYAVPGTVDWPWLTIEHRDLLRPAMRRAHKQQEYAKRAELGLESIDMWRRRQQHADGG